MYKIILVCENFNTNFLIFFIKYPTLSEIENRLKRKDGVVANRYPTDTPPPSDAGITFNTRFFGGGGYACEGSGKACLSFILLHRDLREVAPEGGVVWRLHLMCRDYCAATLRAKA